MGRTDANVVMNQCRVIRESSIRIRREKKDNDQVGSLAQRISLTYIVLLEAFVYGGKKCRCEAFQNTLINLENRLLVKSIDIAIRKSSTKDVEKLNAKE